jgi:hypothetical protein
LKYLPLRMKYIDGMQAIGVSMYGGGASGSTHNGVIRPNRKYFIDGVESSSTWGEMVLSSGMGYLDNGSLTSLERMYYAGLFSDQSWGQHRAAELTKTTGQYYSYDAKTKLIKTWKNIFKEFHKDDDIISGEVRDKVIFIEKIGERQKLVPTFSTNRGYGREVNSGGGRGIDLTLTWSGKVNDFVDATGKVSMVATGKAIARITVPAGVIIGAAQIGRGYFKDGNTFGYNSQKATTGFAGGLVGAWTGFEVGATIGFEGGFFIGAIPGSVIGGVIGGFVGALGGAYFGSQFAESIIPYKVR